MTNSQRLDCVRSHLQRWLSENATSGGGELQSDDRPESLRSSDSNAVSIDGESILIRDGFYAGRTFKATACGSLFRATWFMEQDELKIHRGNGELMVCLSGDEIRDEIVSESEIDDPDHSTVSIPMTAVKHADTSEHDRGDEGQVTKAA